MAKDKVMDEYIPIDPLQFLSEFKEEELGLETETAKVNILIEEHKNTLKKKANVKQIRLHDFRHSCASLLVNNQAPITVVSSFMGHSNTTETLKTYSHLFKGKLNETMDIINNLSK